MDKRFYTPSRLPLKLSLKPYASKIQGIHNQLIILGSILETIPSKSLLAPINIVNAWHFLATQCPQLKLLDLLKKVESAKTSNQKTWTLHFFKALDFISTSSKKKKISSALLSALHAFVEADHGKKQEEVGKIRKHQNWIGPKGCTKSQALFYPPPPRQLHSLLKELYTYCSSEKDPIMTAGIACAQLLIIHPFMDGNGRVARMLIPTLFMKYRLLSYPILFLDGIFLTKRAIYNKSLYLLTKKSYWDSWLNLYFNATFKYSAGLLKQLQALLQYHVKLTKMLSKIDIEIKTQALIIDYLFQHPLFSSKNLGMDCSLTKLNSKKLLFLLNAHKLIKKEKGRQYAQVVLLNIMVKKS